MLFYTVDKSPRLDYVLDLVSNEIFNEPIFQTRDGSVYLSYSGVKLNYSPERTSASEFYLFPYRLLFETDISEQRIDRFDIFGRPAFFQTEGDFPFDIFAAIFFLVSRYEEYLLFQPDKYGRFPHEASLAFREKFLDFPLINYWLDDFKKSLGRKFPDLIFRMKDFK